MDFQRILLGNLKGWRKSPYRKPLVLRGARQVGKTTVIKKFGAEFDTFIYLNMEDEKSKSFFNKGLSAKELIQFICLEVGITRKGETLLFIDEIQNSPEAVAVMRYFYEDLPELFVISAGSLLEVMMDMKKISFPVGRVEYRYLYPLTFEEFLRALSEDVALELFNTIPVPNYAVNKLLELYRLYTFTGGMPEVISRYVQTTDLSSLTPVYNDLMTAFLDDISKYAKGRHDTDVIRHVIETAPNETSKRITFEHFGNSGYSSRDVGSALRTLERTMILYLRYPVSEYKLPLVPNKRRSPHLQFLDSGLVNFSLGIQSYYFEKKTLSDLYNGLLAEQITAQEITAKNITECKTPLFWAKEEKQSNAEVDFLTVYKSHVYPVEVKSGKTGRLRSLHSYINNSDCDFAIRLYSDKVSLEESVTPLIQNVGGKKYRLLNLPLFCASQIDKYIETYL